MRIFLFCQGGQAFVRGVGLECDILRFFFDEINILRVLIQKTLLAKTVKKAISDAAS